MSSLDSDDLMSTSLPVAKLVKHYVDELGDVLTNRENSFKKEIENLKSDPHSTKKVVTLLDRNGDPMVLERLQYEERLEKKHEECQRLKDMVIQLLEEKGKLTDYVKMVDKKRDMLFMENLKMENVKNNLISELGSCKSKCQELEATITQLSEEKMMLSDDVKTANMKRDMISMENMKMENEKNNLIFELGKSKSKCQELEAAATQLTIEKTILTDHVKMVEEMNLKMKNEKNNSISERNEKIKELENKKLESERLVGVYQEKCKRLDNKIAKMEREMGERKLEFDQVEKELKLANKAMEDLRLEKIELDKKVELFKSKLHNSSTRIKMIEKNFSRMSTTMVGDMTSLINDVGEHGTFEMGWNLDSQELCGRNENSSGNANVDATSPSNGSMNNGLSKKAESSKRVINSDEVNPVQRRKRNRTENIGEEALGSQTDGVSANLEDLWSQTTINDIIASLRRENRVTKFKHEADMFLAFEWDDELCLNAVCALYRQKLKNDGFWPVDSASECALAKYLIDGDKELRLTRSVSQVKMQWPNVITQCRRIASTYVAKLFEIYCAGDDPLFCQQ